MFLGRLRLPGLLILLLLAITGCSSADAGAPRLPPDAAVASYVPPAGAPSFCSTLARGGDLVGVSRAMGVRTVAPQDVEATLALSGAITELRGVLGDMKSQGSPHGLEASVENLVNVLQQARDGTVTDALRTAVVSGLDDVGSRLQPICGFPT